MNSLSVSLLQFILVSLVIVFSGSRLAKYGDVIAEKVGLGRIWVGVILLATVTSLPELISGISAVAIIDVPNIAIGGIIGSCLFNLLLITLIDIWYEPGSVLSDIEKGHIISASFGVILLGVVVLGIFIERTFSLFSIFWIGVYTPLIFVIYLLGVRIIFLFQKGKFVEFKGETYKKIPLDKAYLSFGIHATIIVVLSLLLPQVGKNLVVLSGLSETFVGSLFIALATSLPEATISIAAVKLGAIDLAIGNILGSNLFNIFVLGIEDIFYTRAPLFSVADPQQIISSLVAIIMTVVVVVGMIYESKVKRRVGWTTVLLMFLFVFNYVLLFILK
ncbi:hypothetical protein [Candidatus Oleimmundimicrobium sp.]|uniref:sodium:calcium antiporter n=1 Tax=Candidatus Oleimmundimicrobium sp. TaxID=3060597 RepID=UPI002720FE20|nr:hypothetical protein [Candidatus Oleimmundimicrobium sp.]MDO8886696.1 hypothetical protein [Candidatus Oleimmundimicrobium sp.]